MMSAMKRICLWFGALLLSVTLFSALFPKVAGDFRTVPVLLIFRLTMMFALPVWCLSLPLVIGLKDAEGYRAWAIFASGTLIGPGLLALWSFYLQVAGGDPHEIWHGDPLTGLGGIAAILFALILGILTSSLYVISLKTLHRRARTSLTPTRVL